MLRGRSTTFASNSPGYDGNKGGQIRSNITKTFEGGFVRVNFKYLDDRAIG